MAKLLSSPTTLWVQPPNPAPRGFAAGGDKGSFDVATDIWTPGTTAGVVNLVSWNTVPTGRWVQVEGTRLSGLTDVIVSAVPSWSPSTLAWDSVMDAWNGFAIDTAGSRVWMVAAGGHANSSNNGVYRFDAYRMAWAVERMPSDRALWSDQYKNLSGPQGGTWTGCYESTQMAATKSAAGTLSTINDWGSDELFWDRRPTARHVYSSVVYVPGTNELVMGCRRLWRYSLTAGDWTYRRQFPRSVDGAEIYGIYDEATNEYLFGGAGDGVRASMGYSLSTNEWTSWSSPWGQYAVSDCRHGREVTVFVVPIPDYSYYNAGTYWRYNLDTRQVTANANVQFTGGLSINEFQTRYVQDGGCAMTYVASLNRYWILYRMNAGMRWLQLDPTTTPWSLSPLTFANAAPPSKERPCRKVVFLPDLNAVLFFSDGNGPGYIYKI